jgi:hypothetical protein
LPEQKVYVSCPAIHHDIALHYAEIVKAAGNIIVSRWLYRKVGYTDDMTDKAVIDFEDVNKCDVLVQISLDGSLGGMYSELGMAIALGKRVYVLGVRKSLMHWYPAVRMVKSREEFEKIVKDGTL